MHKYLNYLRYNQNSYLHIPHFHLSLLPSICRWAPNSSSLDFYSLSQMPLLSFWHDISNWLFHRNLKISSKTLSCFFFHLVPFQFSLSQLNLVTKTRVTGGSQYHNFSFRGSEPTEQNQTWHSDLYFTCVAVITLMYIAFIDFVSCPLPCMT